jgi:hypothetical protein
LTDADPTADGDAAQAPDGSLGAADVELKAVAEYARAALARALAGVATVGKGQAVVDEGRAAWGTATMDLAVACNRGRELCQNDDKAFGAWLKANWLDSIRRDDREALLNMARHPELARATLATTKRLSWQNVWRKEIKPKLKTKDTSRTRTEGGKGGRRDSQTNFRTDTEPPPTQPSADAVAEAVKKATQAMTETHAAEIAALRREHDEAFATLREAHDKEIERLTKALHEKAAERPRRAKQPVFDETEIRQLRKALHPDGKPMELFDMFNEATKLFNDRAELLVRAAKRATAS